MLSQLETEIWFRLPRESRPSEHPHPQVLRGQGTLGSAARISAQVAVGETRTAL